MPTITTTSGKVIQTPQDDGPWGMTLDDPVPGGSVPKQGITDPKITGSTPPAPTTPDAGLTSSDPTARIDALYKQAGIKDSGRGSGFADRAYWLEHPSEILNGRLAADLSGTGTDQPTGTPGYGAWLNSGKNAPEAGEGKATRDAFGGGYTDPMGSTQPGAGIPWAPGASQPSFAPPGFHWDASQARFVPDSDPSYRDALLASLQPKIETQTPVPPAVGGGAGGVEPTDPFGAKP